ncbi:hypothetical protein AN960_20890 [Bacillus sp. FJAT-25509]|uniref:hypothetical protein n=1 Tax=Bacillus sp. FJAT-25509 TaxID=1712029 RepID=UPI0006FEEDA1|nr:hypothetical protein [Bacillus sp. FJAT-25509]KQL33533.1 hypothetical protein AN960_20890 [Bacillus sp. FJAT-25509]
MSSIIKYNRLITRLIKSKFSKIMELIFWFITAYLVGFPFWQYIVWSATPRDIDRYYDKILFSSITIIFPILFKLIFGGLPIDSLRRRFRTLELHGDKEVKIIKKHTKDVHVRDIHIMNVHVSEAVELANKIYNRAGAYLLSGCIIAFVGIFLFYSPIFGDLIKIDTSKSILSVVFSYVPRFGAMIFIEVIAFFFLKQYKIMMEEFRYYERIKRRRQDNLTVMELVKEFNNESTLKTILENCKFEESPSRVLNGETTEVIETQKTINDDLVVWDRLIELTKVVKKNK